MEATISLVLLVTLILAFSFSTGSQKQTSDLYIIQREHDLMKARIIERNFSPAAMTSDFQLLFPGKSGFVELNGAKAKFGADCNNGISTESEFSSLSGKNSMRVLVCVD